MLMRFEYLRVNPSQSTILWIHPEEVVLVHNHLPDRNPEGCRIERADRSGYTVKGTADEVATRINAALEAVKPC